MATFSQEVLDLLKTGATAPNPGLFVATASAPFSAPAARIQLDHTVMASPNSIRAFIATDSDSPYVFVTLAETNGLPPATVYCGVRNFGSRNGIMISVFTQGNIPGNIIVILTAMQQSASTYANPVLYTGL
jgi:hypothetical protein